MTDEGSGRKLGVIFRGVVPDGPDPAGRADDVVRRGRRATHRRSAATFTAVGVVALAVVAGPSLLDSSNPTNEATRPSASPRDPSDGTGLRHPFTCPRPGEPAPHVTVPATDEVPAGAVLARICPGQGQHGAVWTAPRDALTTNVDVVADAYNYLPKAEPVRCLAPAESTGFTVTFQYADGSLVRVSAASSGYGECDVISIDGVTKQGRARSRNVLLNYVRELQRQRVSGNPDVISSPGTLSCPARIEPTRLGLIPAGRHLAMTSAIVCVYDPSTGSVDRRLLTADEVAAIDRDFATNATSSIRG